MTTETTNAKTLADIASEDGVFAIIGMDQRKHAQAHVCKPLEETTSSRPAVVAIEASDESDSAMAVLDEVGRRGIPSAAIVINDGVGGDLRAESASTATCSCLPSVPTLVTKWAIPRPRAISSAA
jgi:hypothetical protein